MTNEQELINALADEVMKRLNYTNPGVMACDGSMLDNPCANVLWAPVTIENFLKSGQTEINEIETGSVIPVAPGSSSFMSQGQHPSWSAGCVSISYRLANNGTNHQDIRFDFFIDNEPLDRPIYGSNIYDNANHLIGDGLVPLPLQGRKQCCIGAMNRLRVKISHEGAANQLEQPRIFVLHGARSCCSACSSGKSCQIGCTHEKPGTGGPKWMSGSLQVNFNGAGGGGGGAQPIPMTAPPGHVLKFQNGDWIAVPQKMLMG